MHSSKRYWIIQLMLAYILVSKMLEDPGAKAEFTDLEKKALRQVGNTWMYFIKHTIYIYTMTQVESVYLVHNNANSLYSFVHL